MRSLLSGIAALALIAVTGEQPVSAQDSVRLREIRIPADQTAQWLRGKSWQPISAAEYRALRESLRAENAHPPEAWIEKSEYAATFVDGVLRQGTWSAEVRGRSGKPTLVSLDPSNLVVSKLAWAERPAAWGCGPDGRLFLLSEQPSERLLGDWALSGRKLARSVEFDAKFAPAVSTHVRLRVPSGFTVTASTGDVRGPQPSDKPGWNQWLLDLGSRSQCRLTISRTDAATDPVAPVLLTQIDTTWQLRDDGLRVRSVFDVEVLEASVSWLEFPIPDDLQVFRVTFGGEPTLPWKLETDGKQRRIRVQFPEPVRGRLRPLRLEGIGAIRFDESAVLPQPRLKDALLLDGQATLQVDPTLSLSEVKAEGFVQTAASADDADGQTLVWRQDSAEGRMTVEVGPPRAELTASVLAELAASGDAWTLRALVEWRARSGESASVRCGIAPGWDVKEVRMPGGEVLPGMAWMTQPGPDGGTVLTLELPEPVAEGLPRRLEIALRRVVVGSNSKWPLPIIRPLDADEIASRLAIARSVAARVVGLPEPSDGRLGTVPAFAVGSFLEESLKAGHAYRIYRLPRRVGGDESPTPSVQVTELSRTLTADAWVNLSLRGSTLLHDVRLNLVWDAAPTSHILVYLTGESAEPPVWTLADARSTRLAARLLPSDQHSRWNLPSDGELWQIDLPSDAGRSLRLLTSGLPAEAGTTTARLVFVPESTRFHAAVGIAESLARRSHPQAVGAMPLEGEQRKSLRAAVGLSENTTEEAWLYRAPTDRIELGTLAPSSLVESTPAATLLLRSILREGAEGSDLHEAVFRVTGWNVEKSFAFRLGNDADLLSIRVNDRGVAPALVEGALTGQFAVPGFSSDGTNTVVIRYRTPTGAGSFRSRVIASPPVIPCDVVEFDWECVLPRGFRALEASDGLAPLDEPLRLSWRERLFGVLGRPAREIGFGSLEAVLDRAQGTSPAEAAEPLRAAAGPVFRCTAPRIPETAWIEITDFDRVSTLSWATLVGCALAGLALRKRKVSVGRWSAAAVVAFAVVSLFLLSATQSLIAGSAIVGILLALLMPLNVFVPAPPKSPAASVPTGSTATFRHGAVVSSLLFALSLVGDACFSQETPANGQRPAVEPGETILDVLVPYDPGKPPRGTESSADAPLVYLSPEAVAWQKARPRSAAAPTCLIAASTYTIRVDAQQTASVEARYEVSVLSPKETVDVILPLQNANLGGDSPCRLDGQPAPILPAGDGRGYVVSVPGAANGSPVARHEITVRLNPVSDVAEGMHRLRMRVPESAVIRIIASHESASARFDLPGTRLLEEDASAPSRAVSEFLGVDAESLDGLNLRIDWTLREQPKAASAAMRVRSSHLLEVAPGWVQSHSRLVCSVQNGTADFVEFTLPPRAIVQKVVADVPSVSSQKRQPGSGSRLLVEFGAPVRGVVVDVTLLIPVAMEQGGLTVPPFEFVRTGAADAPQSEHEQIGLIAQKDYQITPEGIDNEKLRPLTPDDFVREANGSETARRPEVCWQVVQPAPIRVALSPVAPTRHAQLVQSGRVSQGEILWTLDAVLTVSGGPAFGHRLLVDPRLEIDRITVTEDKADRLVRWTRRGDQVELLLSAETTGTQDVTLTGRLPWTEGLIALQPARDGAGPALEERGWRGPLPIIQIEDATTTESRLILSHDPEFVLALEKGALTPIASDSEPAGGVLFGAFRLPADGNERPLLRIARRPDRPRVSVVTVLSAHPDRTVDVESTLRITGLRPMQEPIHLYLPKWANEEVSVPEGTRTESKTLPDGTFETTLVPSGERSDLVVRVKSARSIAEPAADRWTIPGVETPELTREQDVLVLAASARWQPEAGSAHTLEAGSIPDWAAAGNSPVRAWEGIAGPAVVLLRSDPLASEGNVLFLESQLNLRSDGTLLGRTEFAFLAGSSDAMVLQLPPSTTIRSLLVDGEPVPRPSDAAGGSEPQPPGSSTIIVPLASAPGPRVVVCRWMQQREAAPRFAGSVSLDLVEPILPRTGAHFISVTMGRDRRLSVRGADHASREEETLLSLLGAWLETAEAQSEAGSISPSVRGRVLSLRNRAAEALAAAQPADGATRVLRARFAELNSRVDELIPPGDSRLLPDAVEAGETAEWPAEAILAGASLQIDRSASSQNAPVEFWQYNGRPLPWIAALFLGAVTIVLGGRLFSPRTVAFFRRHQHTTAIVLGAIWWLFLAPSLVGLALIVAAVLHLVRMRRSSDRSGVMVIGR